MKHVSRSLHPLLPAVEPARREGHSAYCSQPSTFHTPQLALILETKVRDKHPAQRGVCPLTGSSGLRHSRPQHHPPPFPYHQASAAPTVRQLSPSSLPNHTTSELHSCSRNPTVSLGDQSHFLRLPDPTTAEVLELGRPEKAGRDAFSSC